MWDQRPLTHRAFQTFTDRLAESAEAMALRIAKTETAAGLDPPCFAYLSAANQSDTASRVISTYSSAWTTYHLRDRHERVNPVVT